MPNDLKQKLLQSKYYEKVNFLIFVSRLAQKFPRMDDTQIRFFLMLLCAMSP